MPPFATISSTDSTYTGQRALPNTGLMDYKARFYSPALGRFIQPDSIIPAATNPQNWNRFSYTNNNPIKYTDPTGHCVFGGIDTLMCAGALIGAGLYTINTLRSGQEWQLKDAAIAAGVGAAAGLLIGGAVAAVAAGAISTTVGAMVAGAGTGLATGGGGYMVSNIVTKNKFDSGDFAIASGVGGVTGAAGPIFGTTMKSAMLLNAASGAVQYEATYYHHNQKLDFDGDVLIAAGLSGASTLISGPYTKPSSLFSNLKPLSNDSGDYWRQIREYDPVYYPNSPYARSVPAKSLLRTTFREQLPRGLAGGAASNLASGWIDY